MEVSKPIVRKRVRIKFIEPTLTKQQYREEVNVNRIVARYKKTGDPSILNPQMRKPLFADVSSVPSYQDALNTVNRAQESFMALSSDIRTRFDNDPGQLLSFLSDPKNAEEGVSMGLLTRVGTPGSKSDSTPIESYAKGLTVDSTEASK